MTLNYQVGCIPGYGMARVNPQSGPQGMDLVREIAREVAEQHRVPTGVIFSHARDSKVVKARQELAWRLWKLAKPSGKPRFSSVQIGRYLDRDHATILHAVQAYEARMGGGQ